MFLTSILADVPTKVPVWESAALPLTRLRESGHQGSYPKEYAVVEACVTPIALDLRQVEDHIGTAFTAA
jgi:hypothetical protein